MDALLHMEAVTSSHDVKALHCSFDSVSSHVRSLESFGVKPLISKLPEELQPMISRNMSETDWNLKSLIEAVEDEIRVRERVSMD